MSDQPDHNQDPFSEEFQQDPFIEDHFSNRRQQQYSNYGTPQPGGGTQALPEATAILVLGILSLVGSFCYGIPGLILGIIAVAMASKPERLYRADPTRYDSSSYNNMRAGKICGIIGLCLSILIGLIMFIAIIDALSNPTYY